METRYNPRRGNPKGNSARLLAQDMNDRVFSGIVASWLRWTVALILAQALALLLLCMIASPMTPAGDRLFYVWSLIYTPGVNVVSAIAGVGFTFNGNPGLALAVFALYAVVPAFLIAFWRHQS